MKSSSDGWTGRTVDNLSWNAAQSNYLHREEIDKCHGYTVYGHLTPSLKWYFGITKKKPRKRWGKDGSNYKSSPRFYNAILKYGWNNIYHHIVGTGLTREEACALEKELIKLNGTLGDGGYNCTAGGDGQWGRKFSDEQRERMRLSHLGKKSAASKPVWCIETGQMFESCADASRQLGLNSLAVSKAARGYRAVAGGYHFAFIGEEPKYDAKTKSRCACMCVETGAIYHSASDAAKQLGVSAAAIAYAARKGTPSCGFHWRYIDHSVAVTMVRKQSKRPKKYRKKTKRQRLADGQMALFD